MSECVCVSVEEGGREGEGGGADTELKTKTPHVNVGNKHSFILRGPTETQDLQQLHAGLAQLLMHYNTHSKACNHQMQNKHTQLAT